MHERAHLRASAALLALFLAGGLWLEAALGLRAPFVTDDELRRSFLRLGHAHGGLLALANVAVAYAMVRLRTPEAWARLVRVACLAGAALVGGGFAAGGAVHGPTDPGPAILLVPAGAMLWLAALAVVCLVRPGDLPPPGAKQGSQEGGERAGEVLDHA